MKILAESSAEFKKIENIIKKTKSNNFFSKFDQIEIKNDVLVCHLTDIISKREDEMVDLPSKKRTVDISLLKTIVIRELNVKKVEDVYRFSFKANIKNINLELIYLLDSELIKLDTNFEEDMKKEED